MAAENSTDRTIFLEAVEHVPKDRWDAFIKGRCADDVELYNRVERLLRAHSDLGEFHDHKPSTANAGAVDAPPIEQLGTQIGPYKLLQQIGEGGMGVVYVAEQTEPVRRKVALKIIRPGMDSRNVVARFEAERQALAMMDHPNIAKVHDAGATENGRPYFVMELVQGVPITEYCDQCNLTTRERLELFITVCQAVQHAHQKGVIHRDIKPTNVLVAMQDGRPAPKIIDFGVAKAIDQRLTEHTLTTAFAQMVGTPLYMSPEQAELSPMGVDTRSDIYSLGVLLYELLTGATPFNKDRLHAVPYDELRRIIREEEPPRPSARISTLAADLATTIAEHRRTDTRRLQQTVRGELDWIVMKCLEKDRNRRYETPNSLAGDIDRYLSDEPVQACPPSAPYRLKKFIRRNKITAAFVLLLVAAVAALTVSNVAIKKERDAKTTALARAQSVSDLLQEMLGSADAARGKGVDYKVRELLDDFAVSVGGQLADQPEAESDFHATIGRAYRSLKLPEKAQPHFEKAIELRRRVDGAQSEKLAAILVDGAWNLLDQQRHAEAETQAGQALEIYRSRGVTGAPLFHALEILQHILRGSAGREVDAERVTQEALAVARQSGQEFPDEANLLHRYADLKISQGKFVEAEELARQSVDMHHRLHGDRHPETAFGLKTLARALESQQKLPAAEAAVREALLVFRHQFPDDHPNILDTMYQLRTVLEAREDKSGLEALAKEEAETEMRTDNPGYHLRVAGLLLKNIPTADQKEEASRLIRRAIEGYGQVAVDYPDELDRRVKALEGYVLAIKRCAAMPDFAGDVDELNRRLERDLPALLAAFPGSSECQWWTAMTYRGWGDSLFPYSDYLSPARDAFSKSIEILKKLSLSDPKRPHVWFCLANPYVSLGDVCRRSAKTEDAEAAFKSALEIYDKHAAEIANDPLPEVTIAVTLDYVRLAYFLACTHREDEAAEFAHRAALAAQRVRSPIETAQALTGLAIVRLRLGDEAGYREACAKLVHLAPRIADDELELNCIRNPTLGPHAVEDPSVLVKLAEEFAANNSLRTPYIDLAVLGAAHFRADHYEQAARHLEASIAQFPSDAPPSHGPGQRLMPQLLLAMTKWQLNEHDEARRMLREIEPAIEEGLRSPSIPWDRRAVLEIRRREAEALIKPNETDEAVENESRASTEVKQ